MRSKRSIFLLVMGALCLLGALGLTGYNVWDEQRASRSVVESAEQLSTVIQPKAESDQLLLPQEQAVMPTVPASVYFTRDTRTSKLVASSAQLTVTVWLGKYAS